MTISDFEGPRGQETTKRKVSAGPVNGEGGGSVYIGYHRRKTSVEPTSKDCLGKDLEHFHQNPQRISRTLKESPKNHIPVHDVISMEVIHSAKDIAHGDRSLKLRENL